MKRLFDFTVSLILILCLLPIFIIAAISIYAIIGSPVVFKQQRPGLCGNPFYIYKFRTMSEERDASGQLLPDEARLSSFGKLLRKWSIDELPQLFNVINGDLSLVGPRPLLMEYLPLYSPEQMRRHDVKPGITGWAQVNGRNSISWDDKFNLDVWYVDNHSFWLDLKILCITALKVVKREGISQRGNVTMEPFKGSQINNI